MQATQNKLIKQVAEVMKTVEQKFPQVSMSMPDVGFFYKGRVAGKAYYYQNRVTFNVILAKENEGEFLNTVKHEVAHLVTHKLYPFAKAHGPEFKRIFIMLGGNGERCHNYDVSSVSTRQERKFEYKCNCQSHMVTARKHANMQRAAGSYRCKRCKAPVVYVGLNAQPTQLKFTPPPKVAVPKPAKKVVAPRIPAATGIKAVSIKGSYANGTIMYCEKRGKYVGFYAGKIEVRGATLEKAKALYIQKFGFPVQFNVI